MKRPVLEKKTYISLSTNLQVYSAIALSWKPLGIGYV